METVCPCVAGFRLEEAADMEEVRRALNPILENQKIFGVNLYEVGMAERVCGYFQELIAGTGAVRRTLKNIC